MPLLLWWFIPLRSSSCSFFFQMESEPPSVLRPRPDPTPSISTSPAQPMHCRCLRTRPSLGVPLALAVWLQTPRRAVPSAAGATRPRAHYCTPLATESCPNALWSPGCGRDWPVTRRWPRRRHHTHSRNVRIHEKHACLHTCHACGHNAQHLPRVRLSVPPPLCPRPEPRPFTQYVPECLALCDGVYYIFEKFKYSLQATYLVHDVPQRLALCGVG